MITRTLPDMSVAVKFGARMVAVLLTLTAFASACGADQPSSDEGQVATTATTQQATSTTAAAGDVREQFMTGAAGSDSVLGDLRDADLGCVADHLLASLDPDEVLALSALGPLPEQAELTVAALEACDLVLSLVGQGMVEAFADDPGLPVLDVECLLEGVTSGDLVPVLEAQFEDPFGVGLEDREMTILLARTPIMGNLMRCRLEAMVAAQGSDLPEFCFGLADQVAVMMTTVIEVDVSGGDLTDPSVLVDLLAMSDDIFVWLADEVPAAQRADAVLVRDATTQIATIMAEALVGIDGQSTEEEALAAIFAAMTRVQAEVDIDDADLDAASARLRAHVVSRCGQAGSALFDLIAGVTGSPLAA